MKKWSTQKRVKILRSSVIVAIKIKKTKEQKRKETKAFGRGRIRLQRGSLDSKKDRFPFLQEQCY